MDGWRARCGSTGCLRTMRPVQIADILTRGFADRTRAAKTRRVRRAASNATIWCPLPVVDEADRLVGVLTADDVLDVIEEEAEEDLRALAGVRRAEDLSDTVMETARLRLAVARAEYGTAFIAASVIGMFEATIEAVVAVAILMPVNAALGGNAGTQALAVAVRAWRPKELNRSNMARIIVREAKVGVFNGAALALLAGGAAGFAFGNLTLGLVLASAMVMTVIFGTTARHSRAAHAGRPRDRSGVASGVFVTDDNRRVRLLHFSRPGHGRLRIALSRWSDCAHRSPRASRTGLMHC
jgi:magnesium transporter